ncbi:MAG: hypothetical protein COU25_03455 [Candidatus Levybacteria bacterium CG10_big_fil_rev_8_21_14_0_10_35_13]|nr:MAG: hypothetical protein COU25_03455 [Candidatus Levybacteria bacterium CG10_big_fil_rev_8_21_14_0_10_35_13]
MKSKPAKPVNIPGIRNITISGRIGTGKTTLANHLGQVLGWEVLDGGKIFRAYAKEKGFHIKEKQKIPDSFDRDFEDRVKKLLTDEQNHVIQAHLAGFVGQGIEGVYKILVVCNDEEGNDKQSVRIDRLMNRDLVSAEEAKQELNEREEKLLEKFKKLYIKHDFKWTYWDKKYYDLVMNTFYLNQKEAVEFVLKHIGFDDKNKVNKVFENLKKDV